MGKSYGPCMDKGETAQQPCTDEGCTAQQLCMGKGQMIETMHGYELNITTSLRGQGLNHRNPSWAMVNIMKRNIAGAKG